MDYSSARGHALALLEVQPPPERYHHQAEQPFPDRLPYHHQQAEQHGPVESCHMDYIDVHHYQYKHRHHHHHHHHQHHHRIQQQPLQHHLSHSLPVAGGYVDLSGGFIASEASSVSCHIEEEKQGLPQTHYVDQAIVQASYKPCEDGYVSVKTHEDAHFPPKACGDAHILSGRHENLHLAHDGRYSQHQLRSPPSALTLVVPRMRLLCSIGGRIMGRPVDGKLRYCGGDTHLVTLERGISFSDLMGKLSCMYGSALTLKYQLPGEDLDALVSVSSDDDLQNMLDEYDKMVARGGNSWFRLFLFRNPFDCEIFSHLDFGHGRENCCTQIMQRYISAINGFDSKGTSECPFDVHLDVCSNDIHSSSRTASRSLYTTLAGPSFPTKAFSWVSSAPSSVPSSPSVAARLAHCKQCGTGDSCPQISKDQQSFVTAMNRLEVNTQVLSQDRHVDTLKCDHHQSHIPAESPRIQQDPSFSRGDALWMKENGTYFVETEDTWLHQRERHWGTGNILVDSWHDVSKPFESRCEAYCGNHPGAQPLTSPVCHGGQGEDDFSREPVQHGFVEGHKQVPLLHQLHQTGSPLHCEGLTRLQRGPGIGSTCQTTDGHGLLQFSQEPGHIHLQNANVASSVPLKALGSAPRNVYLDRCRCCQQHFQVDRGISVSLGEHSQSKQPSYFGDHRVRRHGLPLLSRFCDGSNFCSDSAALHCLPSLEKGLEFDEQEHDACVRKHTLGRINTHCDLVECGVKENVAHSSVEPVHGLREGNLHQYRSCCTDFHHAKGQHLDKARVFPNPEFQAYIGQYDIHPGNSEENLTAGRLSHDLKADPNLERGSDSVMGLNYSNGQGDLETQTPSMLDGRDVSGYVHMHVSNRSSVFGHKESGRDLKSESFSSIEAEAGSLSRQSLEPAVWVDSPPLAVYDDQLKEREVHECTPPVDLMANTRQLVDGTVNHENTGDACESPSFDCIDSHTRVRSISTSANAGELTVENSQVSSLTHVPEDKSSISYARGSHPKFDHFCSVSSSKPFTLDPDTFRGSATLALPTYDQSPINSVNNATFSFAQSEQKSGSTGKEAPEQCLNDRNAFITAPHQSYGQHQEMAKTDVDVAPYKTSKQETTSVLDESRALSRPSSRQCSNDSAVHDKGNVPLETAPAVQSSVTNEIVQEVNVSGSVHCYIEDDEKELPAIQAEAEAIARGLQIIKNDDLEDLKELGSGTYGTVFHGKWRGSDVAIKRIKASCFMGSPSEQERLISDFWREAGTLSQLHHPNIVAFYGVVPDGPGGTLATVTEYMVNGSLKQVLVKKDRTVDRRKRLSIAMDAAFGMEYLHSKRIVHFDLKSENLLVNMRDAHRPICKVGDFGLSKVKHQTLVSGGVRGTLPWMAPELLNTKGMVTEKVDVYSFGIVMWELLTGEEPYAKMHCGTIIGGIANNNLRPVIPSWCDPSWRDLMERCWSGNPADRPDFSTVASELRAMASSMNVK